MKKADFITRIQKNFSAGSISKEWIRKILEAAEKEIAGEIRAGGTVPVLGLGMFKIVSRAQRRGRNPKTGAPIIIPARKVVKYTPGAAAKRLANG